MWPVVVGIVLGVAFLVADELCYLMSAAPWWSHGSRLEGLSGWRRLYYLPGGGFVALARFGRSWRP